MKMAFGIKRIEIEHWKQRVANNEIAFLTHFWYDPRFPHCHTVTKVGCSDLHRLIQWGEKYDLKPEWIDHHKGYPHFDLLGATQYKILLAEGCLDHIQRFRLLG